MAPNAIGKTSLADRWVLHGLAQTISSVTQKIERYQFSAAGEELRDFTWNDLADWYLEISKMEGDESGMLELLLRNILSLWHPFMPFATEHIWELAGFDGKLMVAPWPEETAQFPKETAIFERLRLLVTDIRRLRLEQNYAAGTAVIIFLKGDVETMEAMKTERAWVERLSGKGVAIELVSDIKKNFAIIVGSGYEIGVIKNPEKEKSVFERMKKEAEELTGYIFSVEQKLQNDLL